MSNTQTDPTKNQPVDGRHVEASHDSHLAGLLRELWNDDRVHALMEASRDNMQKLGYTEHSWRHSALVMRQARRILEQLGYPEADCVDAAIAGLLHDVGNAISRVGHEATGVLLAGEILASHDLSYRRRLGILTAIANHDEGAGVPLNPMAAALILADKSDVHRSRVSVSDPEAFDIHDQVNFAVTSSALLIDREAGRIILDLEIDTEIAPIMAYFEIFMSRMQMCRRASLYLDLAFGVQMNEVVLL